jgi:hypothetical protein
LLQVQDAQHTHQMYLRGVQLRSEEKPEEPASKRARQTTMDAFVAGKKKDKDKDETARESQIKGALDQMPRFGTEFLSYTQACKVIQLGSKRIRSLYLTHGQRRFLLQV